MTGTPIPAGALTVDDEPNVTPCTRPGTYTLRFADSGHMLFAGVEERERARLLSPPQPTEVPDDAVPAVLWFSPDRDSVSAYGPNGEFFATLDAAELAHVGVPVPPYQPTPPAPEPTETFGERLTRESSERAHVEFGAPVTEARTGPLGLSEGDDGSSFNGAVYGTCMANTMTGEPGIFIRYDPAKGMLVELESRVRDWFHEEVFERWAAEDTPATPDPEALLVEKITADWTAPDPADSPTDTCGAVSENAGCRCTLATGHHGWHKCDDHGRWFHQVEEDSPEHPNLGDEVNAPASFPESPVAGERTGPLGLSEGDPLMWNDSPVTFIKDDRGSRLIECESEERVWVDPASTFVVEWDAQPEPAETLADIAAECDGWTDNKWFDDPRSFIYYIHQIAERVKAAQKREREKIEAATRAAPATIPVNRDDLRTVIDASSRAVDRNAAYVRLRAALAAAGLPQEPTEPEPTEPEAQR